MRRRVWEKGDDSFDSEGLMFEERTVQTICLYLRPAKNM